MASCGFCQAAHGQDLPARYGSSQTCHRRFRQWQCWGALHRVSSFFQSSGAVSIYLFAERHNRPKRAEVFSIGAVERKLSGGAKERK